MPIGKIISLVAERGFGFIRPEDGSDDLFFHQADVGEAFASLQSGQCVRYVADKEAAKPRARVVQPAEHAFEEVEKVPHRHPRARKKKPTWR